MAFVQAGIQVENKEVFEKLKGAIEQALIPANVEKFLKLTTNSTLFQSWLKAGKLHRAH